MKKIITMLLLGTMCLGIVGCGSKAEETASLDGSCVEILDQVYENADLSQDFKDSLEYFDKMEIPADSTENILGTAEIPYADSVYSAPMMSSVAYQCVVLRVDDGMGVEEAKQLLSEHANPRKWVCVEAESVVVENVGDVILYVMADTATAEALKTAFLALE